MKYKNKRKHIVAFTLIDKYQNRTNEREMEMNESNFFLNVQIRNAKWNTLNLDLLFVFLLLRV